MQYAIQLLEKEKKVLERNIRYNNLMHNNMNKDSEQLRQITQIKKAVKILKNKNKKR